LHGIEQRRHYTKPALKYTHAQVKLQRNEEKEKKKKNVSYYLLMLHAVIVQLQGNNNSTHTQLG